MLEITKLQIFDFDETLFRVPSYSSKKQVENEELGITFDTAYSFYDHPISLSEEQHHIQAIDPIYSFWKQGKADPACYSVMITHRVAQVSREVINILEKRNIEFDNSFFLGRVKPKTDIAKMLVGMLPNLKQVEIFEDSIYQLFQYQKFFSIVNRERVYEKQMPAIDRHFYIVDTSKVFKISDIKLSDEQRISLI